MTKKLYLVHGKPGCGKTTASKLAALKLGEAYHFSIGDELRARVFDGKPSRYSAELQRYSEELRQSLPVPPHLASLVFEECVETSPYDTIIVDGYPQYPDRLPGFDQTLQKVGARVLAVCVINVSDDIARQRITGRAQRNANVLENEAYITKRLQGYQKNVVPTIDVLSQEYPVENINGDQTPEAIAHDLVAIMNAH